ncbi:MAG: NAD-dependent deacylase [Actinobacteria bacterium]|nr:NAD-dependent deacylase [Actinomycetota bacterium]
MPTDPAPDVLRLADALRRSARGAVVFTGAGISVASGVPSFRGTGGIWTRYDPAEYASIDALHRDPEKVWGFLRELRRTLDAAVPNRAHEAIAHLETTGVVTNVITQNIDGLHQRAGNDRVIELHGSNRSISCLGCARTFARAEVEHLADDPVPSCPSCGGVLKPDVVLFGEQLPQAPFRRAEHALRHCDVLLVVGTSVEVFPAARLPELARRHGASVWEINPVAELPDVDGAIRGDAEVVLPALADALRPARSWRTLPRMLRGLGAERWFADD